jgi:hypothetical protein
VVVTEDDVFEALRSRAGIEGWPPPASLAAVTDAERVIGHRLPPLLRRLYLEVANGGFGPRRGVLGVAGGHQNGDWVDLLDVYQAFSSAPPDHRVPAGLIWVLDWGCTIWTLIDSREPSGPIWGNEGGRIFSQNVTLVEWLAKSLDAAGDDLMPSPPRFLPR